VAEWTLAGLRVATEVARTGSFSAAAERLGYTQSAVSRQVAAAEKAAQTPLFERHARGVRPTAAGEALVRHASRVLDEVAAATQELSGLRDRLAGRLVIAGFPTATAVLVPRAIARLRVLHPGLEVRLTEASTPAQLQALRRGRLEVAVLATGEGLPAYDLDGLHLTELRGGPDAGVAVAASHPFAAREWVEPDDLVHQPWVVGAGDGPQFGAWPGIADPLIAFTARDWMTRLGLVAAGLGIALVPGLAAPAMPPGVRWLPVRGDGPGLGRTGWVATRLEPSAAAAAMVRALEEELRSWASSGPR
jgi:DNA-binding transcriptional LysR family regulator